MDKGAELEIIIKASYDGDTLLFDQDVVKVKGMDGKGMLFIWANSAAVSLSKILNIPSMSGEIDELVDFVVGDFAILMRKTLITELRKRFIESKTN